MGAVTDDAAQPARNAAGVSSDFSDDQAATNASWAMSSASAKSRTRASA
jgi:hypothetical protein